MIENLHLEYHVPTYMFVTLTREDPEVGNSEDSETL